MFVYESLMNYGKYDLFDYWLSHKEEFSFSVSLEKVGFTFKAVGKGHKALESRAVEALGNPEEKGHYIHFTKIGCNAHPIAIKGGERVGLRKLTWEELILSEVDFSSVSVERGLMEIYTSAYLKTITP